MKKKSVIFDRKRVQQNRKKIQIHLIRDPLYASINFLMERLSPFKGPWTHVAEIGTLSDHLSRVVQEQYPEIQRYIRYGTGMKDGADKDCIEGDEEGTLPFDTHSMDLVLGHLTWHFLNDLPAFLKNIQRILRPHGLMSALFIGGESLYELHHVFSSVYWERKGGGTPIIAPMIHPSHLSPLLLNAGFFNPVVSVERITFLYENLVALLKDIQSFGGQACLVHSDFFLTPDFIKEADVLYRTTFGQRDGKIPLTLDIIFISGEKGD